MPAIIELTQEELNHIVERRELQKKEKIAEDTFTAIKEDIELLNELGYRIELPSVGGKYVRYHTPIVRSDDMSLHKK